MATSGSVTSGKAKSSYFYINWQLASQSVENNTSTINYQGGFVIGGGNLWYTNAIKIYSSGTTGGHSGTYSNVTSNGTYQKFSGSFTVNHDTEGNASVGIGISGWFYDYGGKSGYNTFSLPNIPRASEFTINKSSLNINATGSTSQSASISITKKNSSFTHKLYYSFGSGSSLTAGLSTASPGTSCTFTPPVGLGAYIPSALSGTCTLTLDTYNGSTKIGTKSTSLTLKVDTSLSDFQLKGSIALSENNSALTGSA
jgi:hypothetical protein